MACPMCDYGDMNRINASGYWFWCPRCGTLRECAVIGDKPQIVTTDVPLIVERFSGLQYCVEKSYGDGSGNKIQS